MDGVNRVLPWVERITSQKSAKDTQHKKQNKYPNEKKLNADDASSTLEVEKVDVESLAVETTVAERRTGSDRRLSAKKRGRWLESRERKERRTPIAIKLEI